MDTQTGTVADAVVIGAGPNGLVAAIALADAGWDVIVVEAAPTPGGAIRSGEVTAPGFTTDLFSAFYPLAAASPVMRGLELEQHGLEWVHAPTVLAHALDDGRVAVLHRDPHRTAAGLDEFATGDGDAWLTLVHDWRRIKDPLLDALFTPLPPIRAVARLARTLRTAGLLRLARLGVTPVRRLGDELFRGDGGPLLLTGNAMHSDLPPDAAGSGLYGWLLAMLAQDVGFPVPRTGAGALASALTTRAVAAGAEVRCGVAVTGIDVHTGRARGVRLADGTRITARKAVIADVPAPALYRDLLPHDAVPQRIHDDLDRFQWDNPTLKVNWALSRPVPWQAEGARGAGTVHLGADSDGLVDFAADLSVGRRPARPFVLFGQMTTADATRSPAGTESAWAYTHLPHPVARDEGAVADHVERVQQAVERVAPGFGDAIVARHVQSPHAIEQVNPSLVDGAINGGTAALHQQLVLRPTPGLGRPETPVRGVYLAGASAHPGGGVHGACGWNAARAALQAEGRLGAVRSALVHTAWERLLRD